MSIAPPLPFRALQFVKVDPVAVSDSETDEYELTAVAVRTAMAPPELVAVQSVKLLLLIAMSSFRARLENAVPVDVG
jgi:hypothetical protein